MISLPAYGSTDDRMLRSHLSLLHGVYVGDVKDGAGLVACHEDSHADPDPHFVMKHDHDGEPVVEDVEEWTGW